MNSFISRLTTGFAGRLGMAVAVFALVWMLAANAAEAATTYAQSSATSKGTDWFGTGSGWVGTNYYLGKKAPVGVWDLDYRHWTGGGPGPGWATFKSPPKPPAATWGAAANTVNEDFETTWPSSSYAKSWWYINPYEAPAILGGGYFAKIQTYSYANSSTATKQVDCETRVVDPWHVDNPNTGSEASWSLGGGVSLWGEIDARGRLAWQYQVTPDGGSAVDVLSIDIVGDDVTVSAAPGVELYLGYEWVGTAETGHYEQSDSTAAEIETYLESSLDPAGGWALTPTFDLDGFDLSSLTHLDQIANVGWMMEIDDAVSGATIGSSHISGATAIIPEPGTLVLVVTGLCFVGLRSRRRRGRAA